MEKQSNKIAGKSKASPKTSADQVCRSFGTASGCKFGDKCRFKHVIVARAAEPSTTSGAVVLPAPVEPIRVDCLGRLFSVSTVAISPQDHALVEFFAEDLNVVALTGRRPVAHPLSHAARELVVRQLLASELGPRKTARVFSIYGAGRDLKNMDLAGFFGPDKAKIIPSDDLRLVLECGPNQFYPGDAGKTVRRTDPSGLYDLVYMVDVYWDGPGRFGPTSAVNYCKYSLSHSIFIITRMFKGAAGCDQVPGYAGDVEGVWYKQEDGLVVFSPDRANYTYPLHYDMEWLRDKALLAKCGLSAVYIRTCGPYDVIKVSLEDPLTRDVAVYNPIISDGLVEWKQLPRPGFLNWAMRTLRIPVMSGHVLGLVNLHTLTNHTYSAPVHMKTASALLALHTLRPTAGNNLDTVRASVTPLLRMDEQIREVCGRFQTYENRLVAGTADFVMFGDKGENIERYVALRSDVNEAETRLVAARSAGFNPSSSRVRRALIMGLMFTLVAKMGYFFGAHAAILPYGQGGTVEEPWFVGALIVAAFLGAAFYTKRRSRRKTGIFQEWEENHYHKMVEENVEPGYEHLPADAKVRSITATHFEETLGLGSIKGTLDGEPFSYEAGESLGKLNEVFRGTEYSNRKSTTIIAVTNGHLFQPELNAANLWAATTGRLHCVVQNSVGHAWDVTSTLLERVFYGSVVSPWGMDACAAAMGGSKGKKLLQSFQEMQAGLIPQWRKKVTLKWNETIGLKSFEDGFSLRPRTIVVFSNEIHATLSPWAHGLSDLMHILFDGRQYDGVRYYYSEQSTINEIGQTLYALENVVAASGDDSICCFHDLYMRNNMLAEALRPILEGDCKAMDQSEKDEAVASHCMCMLACGVPVQIVELYRALTSGDYTISVDDGVHVLKMKGHVGTQLATGIDFTTCCNTLTVIGAWMYYVYMLNKRNNPYGYMIAAGTPVDCFKELGLTLKLKSMGHANEATFLKGWYVPSDIGVIWYPLPSQVLKIGKLMRPFARNEDVFSCAWAVAQSMPNVSDQYPILGPFLAMLRRLGRMNSSVLNVTEGGWYKPQVSRGGISRDYILSMIINRYGISVEEIEDCESLMAENTCLPVYLQHAVFYSLANIDYS